MYWGVGLRGEINQRCPLAVALNITFCEEGMQLDSREPGREGGVQPRISSTYVVEPRDFVLLWISPDVAFEVDVVALLYIRGVEGAA